MPDRQSRQSARWIFFADTRRNAEVVSNPHTHKSKGFAFVLMETVDEAKRAVVELHGKEFMGRKLVVSGAKTSDRPERAEA